MFYSLVAGIVVAMLIVVCVWMQIRESFIPPDPAIDRIKSRVESVFPEIGSLIVYEDTKSYCVNKQKIFLCIRNQDGVVYNDHIITYVLLHEMAHMQCKDVGHTPQFQYIFNQMLVRAEQAGIYDMSTTIPPDYCMTS